MQRDDCVEVENCALDSYSKAAMHAAIWAQDFDWAIRHMSMDQGDDKGSRLFRLVRECIKRHNFAEARIILLFLQENLLDGSCNSEALATLHIHLEALWQKSGKLGADLTMGGIAEYLATYAARLDVEGVLAARDRFSELIDGEYIVFLNRCTDDLLKEIVAQPIIREEHRGRFRANLACLEKMDSVAAAQLAAVDIGSLSQSIFLYNSQVFVRSDGIWKKPLREKQDINEKFLREGDHKAIAISCQSAVDLFDLMGCFGRESSGFDRRLCYVLVDFIELASALTVIDLNKIIGGTYAYRFIDKSRLEEGVVATMRHQNCQFPTCFFHLGAGDGKNLHGKMVKSLAALEEDILEDMAENAATISKYYGDAFLATIPDKIARRNLRILLWTSRHTVFAQYAIRDVADAMTALGNTCMVLKEGEQEGVEIRRDISLEHIRIFKPDLIISMNYNRRVHVYENIPWINWVQDEVQNTFGEEGRGRFGKHDFLGYAHPHWRERLLQCGYPDERFFHFPLGTNVLRFQPDTNTEVRDPRSAEISYVANCSSTPQEEFFKFQATIPTEFRVLFEDVFCQVASAFAHDKSLWSGADYAQLIHGIMVQNEYRFHDQVELVREIADQFWHLIGARFYRQQPLLWLSEAGYDLALYGRGWEKHPLLAKHARGYVAHGEALSKIYSNSAINLSIHETGNYTARIFDGIASGGFFLSRYHPADFLDGGLKDYLNPDTDMIYFSDRHDLLGKVDFYLNNKEDRDIFVDPVRKKILDKCDYKIIMNDVLAYLQRQYERLPS